MKILFNTKYPNEVASSAYINALKTMPNISFGDWDNYEKYDIALFMTYKDDLIAIKNAKISNSNLKVGLIDPRGSQIDPIANYVDFFIVDSIEMSDFFAKYQKPIFLFYEYPDVTIIKKEHKEKNPLIIGYHGNRLHLEGMYPNITKAIEYLGDKYNIEFWAMYNLDKLGIASFGVPKKIKMRHIQWAPENYTKILSKVDIGIVPSLMPIKNLKKIKKKSEVNSNFFNDNIDDYLIRFKMPTNPGRMIVFGKLGIPIVADMHPSALQFIDHGYNGFIAYSCGGWYRSLETLICDHTIRNDFSNNMRKVLKKNFDFEIQIQRLNSFFKEILKQNIDSKIIYIEQPKKDLTNLHKFRKFSRYIRLKKFVNNIFLIRLITLIKNTSI